MRLEAKTANLAYILHEVGANVTITDSNPLTTQDDIAMALSKSGVEVHAKYGETEKEYWENYNKILDINPHIISANSPYFTLCSFTRKLVNLCKTNFPLLTLSLLN